MNKTKTKFYILKLRYIEVLLKIIFFFDEYNICLKINFKTEINGTLYDTGLNEGRLLLEKTIAYHAYIILGEEDMVEINNIIQPNHLIYKIVRNLMNGLPNQIISKSI